jgi:hypothetical protein
MSRQRQLQWGVVVLTAIALPIVFVLLRWDSSDKAIVKDVIGQHTRGKYGKADTACVDLIKAIEQSDPHRLISFSKNGFSIVQPDGSAGRPALQLCLHHYVEYSALSLSAAGREYCHGISASVSSDDRRIPNATNAP